MFLASCTQIPTFLLSHVERVSFQNADHLVANLVVHVKGRALFPLAASTPVAKHEISMKPQSFYAVAEYKQVLGL